MPRCVALPRLRRIVGQHSEKRATPAILRANYVSHRPQMGSIALVFDALADAPELDAKRSGEIDRVASGDHARKSLSKHGPSKRVRPAHRSAFDDSDDEPFDRKSDSHRRVVRVAVADRTRDFVCTRRHSRTCRRDSRVEPDSESLSASNLGVDSRCARMSVCAV